MDLVIRAAAVYAIVWAIFRVAGRRTLKDITTFDFVLVLIVSECVQQALVGQDHSLTGAALAVGTLVSIDILLSLLKLRFKRAERVMDAVPVILIEKGRAHEERMRKERIDPEDILASARENYGIARLDRIDYAILETNGQISVIPKAE